MDNPKDDVRDGVLPRLDPDEAGFLGDELESLRDMVRRGDRVAVAGGKLMAWWGLCMAVQFAAYAGVDAGLYREGPWRFGLIFLVVAYAGHFGLLFMARLRRRAPVFKTWRTQAISSAWLFAGLGLVLISIGKDATGHGDLNDQCAFGAILFAIVEAVIAAAGRRGWMFLPAAAWMTMAGASYALRDGVVLQMAFSICCVLFLMIPGFILWFQEASET
ncbi:MAG: hypothetical protein WDN06_15115 [Asticcacaulis sp.]